MGASFLGTHRWKSSWRRARELTEVEAARGDAAGGGNGFFLGDGPSTGDQLLLLGHGSLEMLFEDEFGREN